MKNENEKCDREGREFELAIMIKTSFTLPEYYYAFSFFKFLSLHPHQSSHFVKAQLPFVMLKGNVKKTIKNSYIIIVLCSL